MKTEKTIKIALLLGWTQVSSETAKRNPPKCGEYVFCVDNFEGEEKIYRRHKMAGDFFVFSPFSEINDAWIIIDFCKTLIFSKRRKFIKILDKKITKVENYILAWPDALFFLTPDIICDSFLEAFENENLHPTS